MNRLPPLPTPPPTKANAANNMDAIPRHLRDVLYSTENNNKNDRRPTSSSLYHDNDDSSFSWTAALTTTAVLSLAGMASYGCWTLVKQYGWEGAMNYIWEGDPYPHIRQYLTQLDQLTQQLDQAETILGQLQETRERAQLECIDYHDTTTDYSNNKNIKTAHDQQSVQLLVQTWQDTWKATYYYHQKKRDLATVAGGLSQLLDRTAARIDAVPAASHALVKQRKKALSQRVVQLMEQTDHCIGVLIDDGVQNKK